MRAHVAMLPRLTAEESIVSAQRTAVGAGMMRPEDRMAIISAWERTAQLRARRQAWQEQMEILREITAAMGGNVPPKASPTDS